MPTAAINGTEIWYELVGEGAPCLVMHGGLGMDHTCFRPWFDRLADRLQLVYYDHRRNGRSARPPLDTVTMEQLADDADALAEHLGHERVVVIGHSYGGFIAQETVLRHPERVRAVVLIGTTPGQRGTGERTEDFEGPPLPKEFIELLSSPPTNDDEFVAFMRRLLPHYFHRFDPAIVEPAMAQTIFDLDTQTRSMQVLAGWSAADRLPSVAVPTLLIVGSQDVFAAPGQSRRIAAKVKGAEVVEIDEAGHFPWMEQPEAFFSALEGWLDRVAG